MNLIVNSLSPDIQDSQVKVLDGTPKSKWKLVLKKQLDTYENLIYGMLCTLSKLGNNYADNNLLTPLSLSNILVDIECEEQRVKMLHSAKKDKEEIAMILIQIEDLLEKKFGVIATPKAKKNKLDESW